MSIPLIGQQIRIMRKVQKLSMRELALRSKMSPGHLSEVERDLKEPGIYTVVRVAKELHMTVDTLLTVHIELCPECDGRGTLNPAFNWAGGKPPTCPMCRGTGQVVMHETGGEISE